VIDLGEEADTRWVHRIGADEEEFQLELATWE
jgi:hypothetical protein